MAKITNLAPTTVIFKSRNGVSYTIGVAGYLTLPDYEVSYDQVDSGIESGWLSVTTDAGAPMFDVLGNTISATPIPVSIDSGAVTITGPVTVASEVEINNDVGNPIPVTGPLTDGQLRADPLQVQVVGGVASAAISITNNSAVNVTSAGASLLTASSARLCARFNNLGPDPVALGSPGILWSNRCIVLLPGDIWIEDEASGLAWSAVTETGKSASVTVQEILS